MIGLGSHGGGSGGTDDVDNFTGLGTGVKAALKLPVSGSSGLVCNTSPEFTYSITCNATFTAFAGATLSLTIGGTGGSSEVIIPGTKEASTPTIAALRTQSLGVQGKVYIGGYLNLGTATWLLATTTNLTNYNGSDTITSIPNAPTGAPVGTVKWIAIDDSGVTRYIPTWELAPP